METFLKKLGVNISSDRCIIPIILYFVLAMFGLSTLNYISHLKDDIRSNESVAKYWQQKYNDRPIIVEHDTLIQLVPTKSEVLLLARMIHSEATNQPPEGQLAVAEVAVNRLKYKLSKNKDKDLYSIITQKNQFDGVTTKRFWQPPSNAAIVAAYMAVMGSQLLPEEIYYFANEDIATDTKWIHYLQDNDKTYMKLGDHTFYKL